MRIVVDASAVVAILNGEPRSDALVDIVNAAEERLLSAATVVELGMVVESRSGGRTPVERVLDDFALRLVAVDEKHVRSALSAWRRFGKGRHPAGLNYGDCFSYALADVTGLPLLYVGNDFSLTDIASAHN